jgi:hypothetical protein
MIRVRPRPVLPPCGKDHDWARNEARLLRIPGQSNSIHEEDFRRFTKVDRAHSLLPKVIDSSR